MIERLVWPTPVGSDPASPFDAKSVRPLRLTFHESSFGDLSATDASALQTLRELSHLEHVKAIATQAGALPSIRITTPDHDRKDVEVEIEIDGGSRHTGLTELGQWKALAQQISGQQDGEHFRNVLEEVLLAGASHALRQDIFITGSHTLHKNKDKVWIRHANVRSPSEAARVLGLLLRSRGIFIYAAGPGYSKSFDRGMFYWALTRHRLPSLWHYFSGCLEAERLRKDDTGMIAGSVLTRCDRAHQARDAVARLLHVPQGNNVRDEMMYHFEYLTLLLSGALDAEAKIAHRACAITKSPERLASFRRPAFTDEIRSAGHPILADFIASPRFVNVSALVSRIRNTIHGAGMPTVGYHGGGDPQKSFVEVTLEHRDAIWSAAEALGGPDRWGLWRSHGRLYLEPCSYGTVLLSDVLQCIDSIAERTNLGGLFPDGYALQRFPAPPDDDRIFGQAVGARLTCLA